ncbi:glycerophosphodiester phosphodiesterase family protein [Sphingobacterium yanglingense]|uniref:Glycerophosphoryl diester phosphodiesterase n=1 Tax=Sphingobacterium yanglingense TaxID=1437280 RepID=A0A4R6WL73_9SPHI|nr:glycerophosphodiester phosphodiesterase family protein [Sphingobacterium yanglingense]TDQ79472.1 glycerophosphoryl diester phosphodiesterase [Sphingobacterium yanglingense]
MIKHFIKSLLVAAVLIGQLNLTSAQQHKDAVHIEQLRTAPKDKIWVIAHRGDWRHAPENSIQAIKNCIAMGVDMVEIDVQLTKDGHAVLMHDKKIDRTTTGKGEVKDWTLDSLQQLRLRDGLGVPTPHRIPTLEEALTVCKDKILINIDKGFDFLAVCLEVAQKTHTLDQVILKSGKPYAEVRAQLGEAFEKVHFMPIVNLGKPDAMEILESHLANYKPIAIEFTVPDEKAPAVAQFVNYRAQGINVWVNSLWPPHNDGHDDERAALDPSVYDWYPAHQVNMIQTDRPQLLIDYLKGRK